MTVAPPVEERTHGPTGKLAGEMAEDEARARDAQVITVRCALCPEWAYTGPAGVAREESVAHREREHPKAERARKSARVAEEARIDGLRNRESLEAMDAGRPQPLPARVTGKASRTRWTCESAIAAVQAWAAGHDGFPPSCTESTAANGLPSGTVSTRLFGSHADMVVASGFDRPMRGVNPRQKAARSAQERAVAPAVAAAAPGQPEPLPAVAGLSESPVTHEEQFDASGSAPSSEGEESEVPPVSLADEVEEALLVLGPGPLELAALAVVDAARAADEVVRDVEEPEDVLAAAVADVHGEMDELVRALGAAA